MTTEPKNTPDQLSSFLSLVQNDASIASLLFDPKKDPSQKNLLKEACQHLFQQVERLHESLQKLERGHNIGGEEEKEPDDDTPPTLSGLNELYLGDDFNDCVPVDAETIWGQVDLQNEALHILLKKNLRKLSEAVGDKQAVRILNLESEVFGGGQQSNSSGSDNNDEDASVSEEEEVDEDEVARRMRERMERTLNAMYEDDDENEEVDSGNEEEYEDTRFFGKKPSLDFSKKVQENSNHINNNDEDLIDPAAEELNNGFFDINEMEAFADEEEDMLPEQVWDPTPDASNKKDKKSKKSFHQRQREGIDGGDSDNEDEDEEFVAMTTLEKNTKRKKYREDDEVEALFSMYSDKSMGEGDDDDEIDEAVNMRAADFFGQPDKKYFHKWKAQQETEKKTAKATSKKNKNDDDDDADSWDEYKFDEKEAHCGGPGEEYEDESVCDGEEDNTAKRGGDADADVDSDDGSSSDKKSKSRGTRHPEKPTKKSRHAQQSEKLLQETKRLEEEMLREKPWQMLGESAATARPVNSLLSGTPEFSVASKRAPVITEEHTANLEEIIKRRILHDDCDDVIPRELPDVAWHKNRGELPEVSQEKAKLGLGELYEREYLKKAIGYDVDAAEKESEEDKAKNELKQLFANICSKLDALSNYHFAPRPVAEEAEARPATTPAIAMEEVLPLHVSDARGAAPEEVFGKKRGREGILRSETELEQSERKRIRSAKKAARRKARQAKAADDKLIARVNPGLGLNNPYEKRKVKEEESMARAEGRISDGKTDTKSGYGSSGKFFRQMQDEVSKSLRDRKPKEPDTKKQAARNRKSSTYKM